MEDFVTYDLAVNLKEKGFNEPCYGYYHLNGGDDSFELCGNDSFDFLNSLNRFRIAAPFISQVLKWLREEKGLHIEIRFDTRGFGACIDKYDIHTLEYISFNPLLSFGFHKSYEEAVIEGIEYVIDNLI